MKTHFIFYSQFSNLVIDYSLDENIIADLDSRRKLKSRYKNDLFIIFVKRGVSILRYFQRWVKADVFTAIFYEFKPGVDCNDMYFKIANYHYISSITS